MADSPNSSHLDSDNGDRSVCSECANRYRRPRCSHLPMLIGAGIGGVLGLISYVKDWL